jgi:nucleotide-binding universal stress UspA family protein
VNQKNDQRPIVCGTDFSATAAEAVDIAAAMARRLGTKLVLVHVDEFYGMAAVDPRLFEPAVTHAVSKKSTSIRSSFRRSRLSRSMHELCCTM